MLKAFLGSLMKFYLKQIFLLYHVVSKSTWSSKRRPNLELTKYFKRRILH